MSLMTLEALVLSSRPFRDTSRLVVLLSREEGLVSGVAKGARAPGSRFGAGLELFCHTQVVLYYKRQRDLQLFVEADPLECFTGLWEHVDRYLVASAAIEFLRRVLAPGEAVPALLDLTLALLETLERSESENRSFYLRSFQLKVCDRIGLRPELWRCVFCGREERLAGFAPGAGGLVCERCRGRSAEFVPIAPEAVSLLAELWAVPLSEAAATLAPVYGAGSVARRDAARAIESFLRAHLERYSGSRSMEAMLALRRAAADR